MLLFLRSESVQFKLETSRTVILLPPKSECSLQIRKHSYTPNHIVSFSLTLTPTFTLSDTQISFSISILHRDWDRRKKTQIILLLTFRNGSMIERMSERYDVSNDSSQLFDSIGTPPIPGSKIVGGIIEDKKCRSLYLNQLFQTCGSEN